jgi:hypothetical protein
MQSEYRLLNEYERQVLLRLLEVPFHGRDEIRSQIHTSVVRQVDTDGSIAFNVESKTIAPVMRRIPVEAEAKDRDGVPIHFLMHVVDGKIHELEIYKADGSKITQMPEPSDLELLVLPVEG